MIRHLCVLFGLGAALAFAQDRPLDNIASRQYQHEVRTLRLALDRWLHELGLQDFGLSIRLVKASDEYAKLPGCLGGHQWESDSNTTAVSMISLPSLANVVILDPFALTRDSRL